MWFHTRFEAAKAALHDLASTLPSEPDNSAKEWGTVIYKVPFTDGSYGYCYQVPYQSKIERRWSPSGDHMYGEYGGRPVAYCHTHPTLEGFSTHDTEFVDETPTKAGSVAYMVNRQGAYSYDGRNQQVPKSSRFMLMWGQWWVKD